MNKWFKKFPYPGWLVTIIAMLTISTVAYQLEEKTFSHESLVADVQRDFNNKENDAFQMATKGMFDNILKHNETARLPSDFLFYILKDTTTFLWNTTVVDMPSDIRQHADEYLHGKLSKLKNGYYYLQAWPITKTNTGTTVYSAFTAIPIFYEYPLENQYFKSYFQASPKIPNTTAVLDQMEKGAYPVYKKDGTPAFFLKFHQAPEEYYVAGWFTWLLAILTCLCIIFWIHELTYGLGIKKQKPIYGFFILVPTTYIITFLLQRAEFPTGFQNSKIFSPELYSSSIGIKSFGTLMINVMLDSWCLAYLIAYVNLEQLKFAKNKIIDWTLRLGIVAFIVFYLHLYAIFAISKMERDSKISFEAGNYSSLNIYTFLGIFTVVVITINIMLLLSTANSLLHNVAKKKYFKFLILTSFVATLVFWVFRDAFNWFYCFYCFLFFLALCNMFLIDKYGFPLKKKRNQYDLKIASSGYVWFAILCSWATLEIFYFNFAKEMELRKVFAYKQEQKNVGNTTFNFIGIMDNLQEDSLVNGYFQDMYNPARKSNVTQYITHVYLNDYYKKFNIGVYFYDKNRKPILEEDTVDQTLLKYADSINKGTFNYGLVDVESIQDGDYIYWFLSPYLNAAETDTLGYIGFNIYADKRFRKGNLNPFFTVRRNPTDEQYYNNYSYAIYFNTHLWTQEGDIVFPSVLRDTINKGEIKFAENTLYSSSLLYRSSKDEIVKVVYTRNVITNIISLFSYVLAILLLLSAVIFLVRYLIFYPGKIWLIYRNFTLTIRSKVNMTILVTVFLSLFVVGFITLSFLATRYKETQRKSLQSLLMFYSQYISHSAEEGSIDFEAMQSNSYSTYSEFSYRMCRLAEEQGAEVNIYNLNGRLIASSQIELYKNGLLSRFMDRSMLLNLRNNSLYNSIKTEKLGNLSYQSLYAPIKNKYDKTVAYMNIPYYASGKELANEMSSVVVTLVNVYALVFFLSGLLALFISNSIIKSFHLLIEQFRNIRLHHNEHIHWPYRDEIALLVNEYNSMMRKVEIMASRLARTEREAAWRDIARQVAHEIKNPLTPMKLNIQYLQQAIANQRPDIEELALKVSDVLIEQIENLNIIATEFSSFAKMPDAVPEHLKLHESLSKLIELLEKDSKSKVELITPQDNLTVYMDKNYFIRVFTNLIQNAIQSIEKEDEGIITISYEQKEHNIVIAIEDNGSGIPKDLQDKLFQPYFTTKSSGTGLGLPMTKNLIENSEGSLWFETKENVGTKFYIRLPLGES